MPHRLAFVAFLVAGLTACQAPRTVVPGVRVDEPTATITLDVPEGYRVVSVSTGADVSGSDGSSSSEVFLNVLAEDVATGERVLLIYQDFPRRRAPVAAFRFREGGVMVPPSQSAGGD